MKLQKNRKSNDHIHNTVAAFWNLYWKYKISRLKATWSKQSFYSDTTSFDRNFHMTAGWKSPHLVAGPAHLIWTAPKLTRLIIPLTPAAFCVFTKPLNIILGEKRPIQKPEIAPKRCYVNLMPQSLKNTCEGIHW